MTKYKASNRDWSKQPTQNNPYSKMIMSYIKSTPIDTALNLDTFQRPIYQSSSYESSLRDKYITLVSNLDNTPAYIPNAYANPRFADMWGTFRELNLVSGNHLYRNEKINIREWAMAQIALLEQKITVTEVKDYPIIGRSHSDYGYEYGADELGFESYQPEKKDRKYPTYDFRDYDVYMAYYKTMGFYVPEGWKIDMDWTRNYWNSNSWYKWRLLVLTYVGREAYQNFQKIPLLGRAVDAADYLYGQKRTWFMYKTLAFIETVDKELIRKMKNALKGKPFQKEWHFRIIQGGYAGTDSTIIANQRFDEPWVYNPLYDWAVKGKSPLPKGGKFKYPTVTEWW